PDLQPVRGQLLVLLLHVVVLGERAVHLEVVAPAGDLQPVVPPTGGELAHVLEREVGPLAGEQRDWSTHRRAPSGRSIPCSWRSRSRTSVAASAPPGSASGVEHNSSGPAAALVGSRPCEPRTQVGSSGTTLIA